MLEYKEIDEEKTYGLMKMICREIRPNANAAWTI